jgi:hypothetical protein
MTERHKKGYHIIEGNQNVEDGEKMVINFYATVWKEVCHCATLYVL